jgi:hypothetical protein
MYLKKLPLLEQVSDRHVLEAEGLRLATAPGLIAVPLNLDQLGKPRDQLGDSSCLVIGKPGAGDAIALTGFSTTMLDVFFSMDGRTTLPFPTSPTYGVQLVGRLPKNTLSVGAAAGCSQFEEQVLTAEIFPRKLILGGVVFPAVRP